jgi:hypothetical protein
LRSARNRTHRHAGERRVQALFSNAAFALLAVALLALGAAFVVACQSLPASPNTPAGASRTNASTTTAETTTADAAASQPVNAQLASGQWIALASTSPADVLAAARQSSMLQQNVAGSGDHASNVSRLGSPIFVRALQPAGAAAGQFPDFYVVPILDPSGAATDAAELALNPSHTAIQVIAIVTYSQSHADGAVVQMSASAAVATVQAQQHTDLRAGGVPELIYFPADAAALGSGQVTWAAGGEFPADPIWLVPGADGRDHLVGNDRRTYAPDQLPMIRLG